MDASPPERPGPPTKEAPRTLNHTPLPMPERLIPVRYGTDPIVDQEIARRHLTLPEDEKEQRRLRREIHDELLDQAPNLDEILREERLSRIQDPEERAKKEEELKKVNLAWAAIEDFRYYVVPEAQVLRKVIRNSTDPLERARALPEYVKRKQQIDRYMEYGLSFEKAYKEYLKVMGKLIDVRAATRERNALWNLLMQPSFRSMPDDETLEANQTFSATEYSWLEKIAQRSESQTTQETYDDTEILLAGLESIYPPGSDEYEHAKEQLIAKRPERLPMSKKEARKRYDELEKKIERLWKDPMVRYLYEMADYTKLLRDFAEGKDVLETQSVIGYMNKLHEWEILHDRTTVAAVIVGPPGTGKTTLARHYSESKGRTPVYMDLSEDVNRYLIFGQKEVSVVLDSEVAGKLADKLAGLSDDEFQTFLQTNIDRVREVFHLTEEQGAITAIDMIRESLTQEGSTADLDPEYAKVHEQVNKLARRKYHDELGHKFHELVKRNGWRDGVILAALRRKDDLILDEAHKFQNWSSIYGLMTAKPGERWYFADNDEWLELPDHPFLFFTANIGRQHGGFPFSEAFVSRASGKTLEVGFAPFQEEMRVALTAISDPWGNLVRSDNDMAKMMVLVHSVFNKIRDHIQDKPQQGIAISYRTLRDLGEKLVIYRAPDSGKPVYAHSGKTFDEALYEVLIDTYKLRDNQEIPTHIVKLCTDAGLLLDDSVKARVAPWLGGEDKFDEAKAAHGEGMDERAKEIINKLKGVREFSADSVPLATKY